jgi:TorA maturation chaperone TorD
MTDAGVIAFCEIRLALFYQLQRAYAAPATPELAADLTDALRLYGALTDLALPPCELPSGGTAAAEAEFNRLFVGPGPLPAPPYESVWRSEDRLLMQAATEAVRSVYRQHGVQNTHPEPDDHLAIELEFYDLLQQRVISGEAQKEHVAAQMQFLTEHLAAWVPAFAQAVETHTTSPFYRNLALVTRRLFQFETTLLPRLQTAIAPEEESAHAHS